MPSRSVGTPQAITAVKLTKKQAVVPKFPQNMGESMPNFSLCKKVMGFFTNSSRLCGDKTSRQDGGMTNGTSSSCFQVSFQDLETS